MPLGLPLLRFGFTIGHSPFANYFNALLSVTLPTLLLSLLRSVMPSHVRHECGVVSLLLFAWLWSAPDVVDGASSLYFLWPTPTPTRAPAAAARPTDHDGGERGEHGAHSAEWSTRGHVRHDIASLSSPARCSPAARALVQIPAHGPTSQPDADAAPLPFDEHEVRSKAIGLN